MSDVTDTRTLPYGRGSRILAPLAGMGDFAMRRLSLAQGAAFTFTEMISAKALSFESENSWGMIRPAVPDERFGVQLFGHEPEVMAAQAADIERRFAGQVVLIDINMGCPVGKVTRKGEGCALMEDPRLAARIASSVVDAVHIPVTAKIRKGFAACDDSAPEFAKRLEDAGISALTVHGRTAAQLYRGSSDLDTIRRVRECLSIPVIGNGDLYQEDDIMRMFDRTGVDAVMIARGALGNPWIFSGHIPTYDERLDAALQHVGLLVSDDGGCGLRRFRKHIPFYVQGMPHASALRDAAMRAETLDEITSLIETMRCALSDEGLLFEPLARVGRHAR